MIAYRIGQITNVILVVVYLVGVASIWAAVL